MIGICIDFRRRTVYEWAARIDGNLYLFEDMLRVKREAASFLLCGNGQPYSLLREQQILNVSDFWQKISRSDWQPELEIEYNSISWECETHGFIMNTGIRPGTMFYPPAPTVKGLWIGWDWSTLIPLVTTGPLYRFQIDEVAFYITDRWPSGIKAGGIAPILGALALLGAASFLMSGFTPPRIPRK